MYQKLNIDEKLQMVSFLISGHICRRNYVCNTILSSITITEQWYTADEQWSQRFGENHMSVYAHCFVFHGSILEGQYYPLFCGL